MSNIKITVDGVQETIGKINMFDMKFKKDLAELVKKTSKDVQKSGKANAPKGKTGNLRSSIRPKYFDEGLSSTVVPRRPKGAHRHLVEYGTRERRTRSGANRGKMPGKPFMAPAEQSVESKYNQEVRSLIDRDEVV